MYRHYYVAQKSEGDIKRTELCAVKGQYLYLRTHEVYLY